MCCYSTGHRRWEIWCHSSFRRRVKPLQHVGQSTASYRHLSYGQLLSLHAWQRGAVGRCQRGGIWRCHKSSIGDLWRPSFWFLRTRLSVWKRSRYRGNTRPDIALRTYRETKTETHVYIFSHNGLFRPLFCFMFVETLLSAWPKTKMTDCEKKKWKKNENLCTFKVRIEYLRIQLKQTFLVDIFMLFSVLRPSKTFSLHKLMGILR